MGSLKKKVILIVLAILVLALALFLTIVIISGYYLNFVQLANLSKFLDLSLSINGRILKMSILLIVLIWAVSLLIFSICMTSLKKTMKHDKVKIVYHSIKEKHSKSNTDLDVLYDLLKEDKKMHIKEIAKIFSIDNARAIEWAKILENNNLATIQYPAFSEPIVEIKEEVKNDEENEETVKKEDN